VPTKAPTSYASLKRAVATSQHGGEIVLGRDGVGGSAPFVPAGQVAGPWRAMEVEVTPDGVKVWWLGPDNGRAVLADLSAEHVRRAYSARQLSLDKVAPDHGIVMPNWNPRAAVGVWANDCAVGVRNVTLEPLK
jgi:hypothetical protein